MKIRSRFRPLISSQMKAQGWQNSASYSKVVSAAGCRDFPHCHTRQTPLFFKILNFKLAFLWLAFQPLISVQTGFYWLELGSQADSTNNHLQLRGTDVNSVRPSQQKSCWHTSQVRSESTLSIQTVYTELGLSDPAQLSNAPKNVGSI